MKTMNSKEALKPMERKKLLRKDIKEKDTEESSGLHRICVEK